ncbi:hypothetical protein N8T08_000737 [Aspergillus melleus]|uniref:Uncharacterized protein n=1 Tax=Aspergillus melleus TaxID=138277 RepID=A0ACC3AP75_9EURO|nr:hypothetical protein N8T08_000737 [Aspergillus melleus]
MFWSIRLCGLLLSSTVATLACANKIDYTSGCSVQIAEREARVEMYECRCGMSEFLSLPHANITTPDEAKHCSDYKLIDARGTSEPQGISTMFYPMIQSILANVSDGASLPVEYPAGPDQNTASGEMFVIDIINQGIRDCPEQTYALFGYSQGATLVLRTLEQLSNEALDAVKSIILVGNPYRIPGKISNVNATAQYEANTSVGMFVTMASSNDTIPQLSSRMDKSGKVLDFCLDGDNVCSYNPACSCQIPAGHLSYGLVDTIQENGFQHVISRIRG